MKGTKSALKTSQGFCTGFDSIGHVALQSCIRALKTVKRLLCTEVPIRDIKHLFDIS